jgi:hypothetical protein
MLWQSLKKGLIGGFRDSASMWVGVGEYSASELFPVRCRLEIYFDQEPRASPKPQTVLHFDPGLPSHWSPEISIVHNHYDKPRTVAPTYRLPVKGAAWTWHISPMGMQNCGCCYAREWRGLFPLK